MHLLHPDLDSPYYIHNVFWSERASHNGFHPSARQLGRVNRGETLDRPLLPLHLLKFSDYPSYWCPFQSICSRSLRNRAFPYGFDVSLLFFLILSFHFFILYRALHLTGQSGSSFAISFFGTSSYHIHFLPLYFICISYAVRSLFSLQTPNSQVKQIHTRQ